MYFIQVVSPCYNVSANGRHFQNVVLFCRGCEMRMHSCPFFVYSFMIDLFFKDFYLFVLFFGLMIIVLTRFFFSVCASVHMNCLCEGVCVLSLCMSFYAYMHMYVFVCVHLRVF